MSGAPGVMPASSKTTGKPASGVRWPIVAFALTLLLAGFAVRVETLTFQPIWWDEARNVEVAFRPVTAIASAGELDIHPPLYFYLLHVWLRAGGGWASPRQAVSIDPATGEVHDEAFAFFARFLSVWMGVLACALLYRLGRSLASPQAGLAALAMLSLSPFWVAEAHQLRMYTTMLGFLLASALLLWEGIRRGRVSAFVGFGALAALSLLTHYSVLWVFAGWGAFAAAWGIAPLLSPAERGELLQRWKMLGAGLAAFALVFAPQVPRAVGQWQGYANPNLQIPPMMVYLERLARAWLVGESWRGEVAFAAMAFFVLMAALGVWQLNLLRSGRPSQGRGAAFALSWLGVALAAYYATFFTRGGAFEPRYIACASPALYLLVGLGWDLALGKARALGAAVAVVGLVALGMGLATEIRQPAFVPEDARELARYLWAHSSPADVILVDAPYPLNVYWPCFGGHEGPCAPAFYVFADVHTVADRLTRLLRGREKVLLVHWFKSDADPRRVVRWLLERHARFLGEDELTGFTVRSYLLPPEGVRFVLMPSPQELSAEFDGLLLEEADWGGREPSPTSARTDVEYVAPGHDVWVATRWRLLRPTEHVLKVACYLRHPSGEILAQDDRLLLNDRHLRTPYWGEMNQSLAFHSIPVPPGTLPGRYRITLAVYDASTLERLPLLDRAGNPQGTEFLLGEIPVIPPLEPAHPEDVSPRFTLGVDLGEVRLLGYDGLPGAIASGQRLSVWTYWQALEANPKGEVSLSLLDGRGQVMAQALSHPLGEGGESIPWREGEVFRSRLSIPVPADIPPGRYRLLVSGAGESVTLGEVEVKGRPRLFQVPGIPNPLNEKFSAGVTLLGYGLERRGQTAVLTLFWRCDRPVERAYTVFTHLLDASGRYVTGHDSIPAEGAAPTEGWLPGEIVVDRHMWELPEGLPPGVYLVEVGLYEPDTPGMPRVPTLEGEDAVRWEVQW